MRDLLMVVHLYPPGAGSSGVLRPLKFSRFLPGQGWRPHVLTVRESLYPVRDAGLAGQIPPEGTVHRTFALDTSRHLAFRRRHPAALAVPDPYIGWLPFAVARGLRVVRRHRVQAIFSTSPPATAHLVSGVLHRATRLPWVADFRDPWIEAEHPRPGTLRRRVESALERWVMRKATRITATTPELAADISERHPTLPREAVQVIYNGYDEDDFAGLSPAPDPRCFQIIHAGLLNADFRNPRPVLEALARLVREGRVARDRVAVTLVGTKGWTPLDGLASAVSALGLEDRVHLVPFQPHRETQARLSRASVLLLLQASEDTAGMIPAKAFEYLRLGLPILALTPGGATGRLLRTFDRCHVLHPSDVAGIAEALATLYDQWSRSPAALCQPRSLEQFERRSLTARLARILDEITGASARVAKGALP